MNKRLLLWLMLLIGVLIVILMFTRSNPDKTKPPTDQNLSKVTVLSEGSMSEVDSYQTLILDDQDSYQEFLTNNKLVIPNPIDLREHTVIAIFMGYRPTAGYSVEVVDIKEENQKMLVTANLKQPGKNCINLQVTTNPYQIVSIKKTNLPIEIVTNVIEYDCP
ncbi:MAG TPA: protease complex subunit PrcB family protein [Caldisericia bacterium]|nr:protease complex subunit PrcB family protein [Caldisericia bacterium]